MVPCVWWYGGMYGLLCGDRLMDGADLLNYQRFHKI